MYSEFYGKSLKVSDFQKSSKQFIRITIIFRTIFIGFKQHYFPFNSLLCPLHYSFFNFLFYLQKSNIAISYNYSDIRWERSQTHFFFNLTDKPWSHYSTLLLESKAISAKQTLPSMWKCPITKIHFGVGSLSRFSCLQHQPKGKLHHLDTNSNYQLK